MLLLSPNYRWTRVYIIEIIHTNGHVYIWFSDRNSVLSLALTNFWFGHPIKFCFGISYLWKQAYWAMPFGESFNYVSLKIEVVLFASWFWKYSKFQTNLFQKKNIFHTNNFTKLVNAIDFFKGKWFSRFSSVIL